MYGGMRFRALGSETVVEFQEGEDGRAVAVVVEEVKEEVPSHIVQYLPEDRPLGLCDL